jgi:Tol biopolymer transport system component
LHLNIQVFDINRGILSRLTSDKSIERYPVWTPDGKRILFGSNRSGTMGAWLLQVADGKAQGSPELIKPDLGPNFTPMGFARNGSYYYGIDMMGSDVYVAELDLTTGKVLVPPILATQRFVGSNNKPDWSLDGRA